ncbi:MAG: DUF6056 family protein [Bacteroidia bacterium]
MKISASIFYLLIVIVPLIILSFDVYPATDDFGFAASLRENDIWSISKSIYFTMDNRLFGNFLTLLFCNSDSLIIHRIQFIVFILIFFSSIYFMFTEINKRFIKSDKTIILVLFTIFSFVFVAYNPGINEAFFWYPGVAVWSSSIVFFNILIIFTLRYLTSKKNKTIYFILMSFIMFILTSQNEIMFLLMFLISVILIYFYFHKKGANFKPQIIFLLFILAIGAAIVLFGPGNYERLKFISDKQPVSFLNVIISNGLLYRKLFFLSDVLIINALLLPFYYHLTFNIFKYIKPLNLLIFSIILLIIFITPSLIAKTLYTFRIQNVIHYFVLIIITINFVNLSIYLRTNRIIQLKYSDKYLTIIVLLFSMTYFLQKESVLRTIYSDILSKKADRFSTEMQNRADTILNSENDTVYVLPIVNKPKSIFIDDISNDQTDWRNSVYNSYYNKTIILKNK